MSFNRKKEDKIRLEKLYLKTKNRYGCGVYYDENKKRYIKYSYGSKLFRKYLKRQSSKKVRIKFDKYNKIQEKSLYKKTFDYWWNLM